MRRRHWTGPHRGTSPPDNERYLVAKRDRTAHTLELSATAVVEPVVGSTLGTLPSHDGMLKRIDRVLPRLQERAEETEQLRRLPHWTKQELKEAGVFHVVAPGAGRIRHGRGELRRGDPAAGAGWASTAWTAGHLIEHTWMLARWPQRVRRSRCRGACAVDGCNRSSAGDGKESARRVLNFGSLKFRFGVMHSEWALLAVPRRECARQSLDPEHRPDPPAGRPGTAGGRIHRFFCLRVP